MIPQIARAERLNPDQLRHIYVTSPDNQFVPLSTIATIHDSMVPRSLNRFQQLNAIKLSGTTPQLDEGRKVLETPLDNTRGRFSCPDVLRRPR